jgi:thiamine-monophosphate kinase
VQSGLALRGLAHAAIDLSDGLAGDLEHILLASGVGAQVQCDRLPASPDFLRTATADTRLSLQVQGGDDYELCFCIAPDQFDKLPALPDVPVTVIGRVIDKPGLRFVDAEGATIHLNPTGYRHFT